MERVRKGLQRKRDAHVRRLALSLQRPRRGAGIRSPGKDVCLYTAKGIDILKDAVSLPGVSLHYLLRGTNKCGTETVQAQQRSVRNAVVGGQSLVFMRYHEAGVTRIRLHRYSRL